MFTPQFPQWDVSINANPTLVSIWRSNNVRSLLDTIHFEYRYVTLKTITRSQEIDRKAYSSRPEAALRDIEAVIQTNNSDLKKVYPNNTIIRTTKASPKRRQINPLVVPELKLLRKLARKALNKAGNSKLDENWNAYKIHLTENQKPIKQIKENSGELSIEYFPQEARLQWVLTKDLWREIGKLKKLDGSMTTELQECLQLLRETRSPDSIATEVARWIEENNTPSDEDWLMAKFIVTEDKIKRGILDLSPF